MSFWLQYHNYDNLGYLPGEYETDEENLSSLDTSVYDLSGITTSKRIVSNAKGDIVFLIVGYGGKSKQYLLWSWCVIERVKNTDDGQFDAFGSGHVLNPPPLLSGSGFDEFRKQNGNFSLGFRNISSAPFLGRLIELAREHGHFELAKPYTEALQCIPEEIHHPDGLFEGAVRIVAVNAYERNPEARRLCIEHHGTACCICGFSFGAVYGKVAEGYIHVHHLHPLSEVGG